MNEDQAVVIMPVKDQTLAGLGERRGSILSALKQRVSHELGVQVIDEDRFDRWMEEQGPGSGEYWILANGGSDEMPADLTPDFILVPVCITSKEEGFRPLPSGTEDPRTAQLQVHQSRRPNPPQGRTGAAERPGRAGRGRRHGPGPLAT